MLRDSGLRIGQSTRSRDAVIVGDNSKSFATAERASSIRPNCTSADANTRYVRKLRGFGPARVRAPYTSACDRKQTDNEALEAAAKQGAADGRPASRLVRRSAWLLDGDLQHDF